MKDIKLVSARQHQHQRPAAHDAGEAFMPAVSVNLFAEPLIIPSFYHPPPHPVALVQAPTTWQSSNLIARTLRSKRNITHDELNELAFIKHDGLMGRVAVATVVVVRVWMVILYIFSIQNVLPNEYYYLGVRF